MSPKNLAITVVVVAVVLLVGWQLVKSQSGTAGPAPETPTTVNPAPTTIESTSSGTSGAMMAETAVTVSATGFSPQNVTIKAGGSVTWMNSDSANHQVNSDPHPTHTAYSPLNIGLLKPGDKKSLTFPTPGTYKYHDHLNPSSTGTITVQ